MAVGSQQDFVRRLKNELPSRWFPITGPSDTTSQSPILDAVLNGIAYGWSQIFSLIQYTMEQTRIATATDVFLDLVSHDYLGTSLPRNPNETDAQFRKRIQTAILAPKATRPAMVQALTTLTGRTPTIFEPANPSDTGGYGGNGTPLGTGLAYGTPGGTSGLAGNSLGGAGGYGSLAYPFQAFIVAFRPTGVGIAGVTGYGSGTVPATSVVGIGAYDNLASPLNPGSIEYANLSFEVPQVTDSVIFDTIASVEPTATIMWTRLSN